MTDHTLGERVGALEDAARSIALQLNGDPDLRIPGRLEQLERELATHRTQIDRNTTSIADTAERRRELRENLDIAIDAIHSRIDQIERDQAAALETLARRYLITLILSVGSIIAGLIAIGVFYAIYLELVR